MMIIIDVLQKVLVNYFYRINAGFLLFVFFVLFGIPAHPVSFHYSLITGIIESQLFLMLVMLIWLLYNVKCVDYTTRQILEPRQLFIFCLNSLPQKKKFLYMLYVHSMIYLPAFIYSLVICLIAVKSHPLIVAEILLFNAAVICLSAYLYLLALQRTMPVKGSLLFPRISSKLSRPFFSFPLHYLFSSKKQMLLVTKLFCLLFLYGFIRLYEPERYDIRPLMLCMLVIAGAHSAVVLQVRTFEEELLPFSRNLPVTNVKRFLMTAGMYGVLLLPEFMMLWKGYGIHFSLLDYPQVALFTLSLIMLFHVTLLMEEINMDQLIRIVFGLMAGLFFILMYNPGILLPCAMFVLSFIFFASYYNDFEKKY